MLINVNTIKRYACEILHLGAMFDYYEYVHSAHKPPNIDNTAL